MAEEEEGEVDDECFGDATSRRTTTNTTINSTMYTAPSRTAPPGSSASSKDNDPTPSLIYLAKPKTTSSSYPPKGHQEGGKILGCFLVSPNDKVEFDSLLKFLQNNQQTGGGAQVFQMDI
jgi:hypothetical protein